MIRNLVTFALSPFHDNSQSVTYHSEDGFTATCTETTETGLKYIIWKLAQAGEQVDAVFPFVTACAEITNSFEKFKALFADYDFPFRKVPFAEDGQFKSVVPSITAMFDIVKEFRQYHPEDIVRIHVDMTGGPRHAPMVMLALLQMLRYQGVDTGLIIYTDYGHELVEDASQILSLFTLVSGADEFTSYGSTRGLQEYFAAQNKPSGELSFLLRRMNQVADTIRLCSNYEGMEEALKDLALAIQRYETYAAGKKITPQDQLFSKLLPQVEEEYSQILPLKEEINPADIITWCVKKGFLQQAMTFYTEWLPRYIIQVGFIIINEPQIKEECQKNGQAWSSWEIYFFKTYVPFMDKSNLDEGDTLSYRSFCNIVDHSQTLKKLLIALKNKNKEIDKFIREIEILQLNNSKKLNLGYYIFSLPDNNILRKVFQLSCPSTSTLENYIKKRLTGENGNLSAILAKAIKAIPRSEVIHLFQLDDVAAQKNVETVEEKVKQRREVFQWLFDHGKITSKLPQKKVIDFVENYNYLVTQWRNQMNHANVSDTSLETNEQIQDFLIQNVAFLTTQKVRNES